MFLLPFLFALVEPGTAPLAPVWSPDHQVLATTKINERYATPEGAEYTLFLNDRRVYPPKPKHLLWHAYSNEHTFWSDLVWSPDGQNLAFTEEVYDWEYLDPFNYDFDGYTSEKRYFLVVVSRDGKAAGYRLLGIVPGAKPRWDGPETISVGSREFDLRRAPPGKIP